MKVVVVLFSLLLVSSSVVTGEEEYPEDEEIAENIRKGQEVIEALERLFADPNVSEWNKVMTKYNGIYIFTVPPSMPCCRHFD